MPSPRLLLVEGPGDREVMYHLLGRYGIARGLVDVAYEEGVDTLLRSLGRWLRQSGLQQLGVIVDADVDVIARWDAVRNRLIDLGYSGLPRRPQAEGVIVPKDDEPTVGIWIMPDNLHTGLLEHFLGHLVPADRLALWKRASRVVKRIPEAECRFVKERLPKAQIHTYLAWQEEPGQPLGLAITKGFLDSDAPHSQRFRAWMQRLFES